MYTSCSIDTHTNNDNDKHIINKHYMHICIGIYVCMYACVYIYIYTYIFIFMYLFIIGYSAAQKVKAASSTIMQSPHTPNYTKFKEIELQAY